MKIAIDKDVVKYIEDFSEFDFVYIFDSTEKAKDLIESGLHCVHNEVIDYVDVNLTQYKIPCIKQTTITDKHWKDKIEKKQYKYAIIVPNYNNAHGEYNNKTYLENCIESILNQSYTNYDLILVDDMSNDNSIDIIKKYNDERIHLIQNIRKRYNGGSRNVGIEYALQNTDCDYICFLDSDDWWKHSQVLEHINDRIHNNEMMIISCEMLYKNGRTLEQRNEFKTYKDVFFCLNNVWCTAWSRIIRKDKIVYFCEDTLMEDRVWSYKQADNIDFKKVIGLNEVCYVWNRLNTSNSVSIVRGDYWNASAYCHIGHQLQLLSQLKHEEMRSTLEKRINACIDKTKNKIYEQY
jgi:glycosyltransferase involved in cell wall biosynthesis